MASRSNVYPCSSSMSQLICHALTLLYSWLHILIFTLNSHTFILHWNQLFNTNVPTQHELYTCTFCCSVTQCTSPFHTVVILLNYTTVLSFSLKYTGWVDVYSIFYLWMQTHTHLGKYSLHKAAPPACRGRLPDRLTCVLWQTECPADSTECSGMYNPSYAVLLLWKPIRLA